MRDLGDRGLYLGDRGIYLGRLGRRGTRRKRNCNRNTGQVDASIGDAGRTRRACNSPLLNDPKETGKPDYYMLIRASPPWLNTEQSNPKHLILMKKLNSIKGHRSLTVHVRTNHHLVLLGLMMFIGGLEWGSKNAYYSLRIFNTRRGGICRIITSEREKS